jgi:hypothetical protein
MRFLKNLFSLRKSNPTGNVDPMKPIDALAAHTDSLMLCGSVFRKINDASTYFEVWGVDCVNGSPSIFLTKEEDENYAVCPNENHFFVDFASMTKPFWEDKCRNSDASFTRVHNLTSESWADGDEFKAHYWACESSSKRMKLKINLKENFGLRSIIISVPKYGYIKFSSSIPLMLNGEDSESKTSKCDVIVKQLIATNPLFMSLMDTFIPVLPLPKRLLPLNYQILCS